MEEKLRNTPLRRNIKEIIGKNMLVTIGNVENSIEVTNPESSSYEWYCYDNISSRNHDFNILTKLLTNK